jgi:hypothetical protein
MAEAGVDHSREREVKYTGRKARRSAALDTSRFIAVASTT